MNCIVCGKELKGKQRKYCSKTCENRKLAADKLGVDVETYLKDHAKGLRCQTCGKILTGKQTRFCSRACSSISRYHKKKSTCVVCGKILEDGRQSWCEDCKPRCQVCGKPLTAGRKRSCSKECTKKLLAKKPKRFCKVCGEVLKGHQEEFCSRKCATIMRSIKRREKMQKPIECELCGTMFVKKNINQKYCEECAAAIRSKTIDRPKPIPRKSRIDNLNERANELGLSYGLLQAVRTGKITMEQAERNYK